MNTATHAPPTATPLTPTPPGGTHPVTGGQLAPTHRNTGRIIGALFLVGFLTYGTGGILTTSILDPDDVIGSVAAHQTAVALGAVLMLTVAAVDIGKSVLFFPLLGRSGRRTALTYLSAMVMEVTVMAVGAVALLSLVPLSDQVQSGGASASVAQSLGIFAVDFNDVAYQCGQAVVAVGAFFLTVFLYRTAMAPRFLALWGAIGYVLHLTGAVAELFGLHISMFLLIPGGLFEVTFGIWLLVNGITSRTDRTEG
jgi:Domain of unknown function (DUF4386)